MRRKQRPKFEDYSTPEALRAALTAHFLDLGYGSSRNVVKLQSGSREYWFYWYSGGSAKRGGRLAVKVVSRRRPAPPNPSPVDFA